MKPADIEYLTNKDGSVWGCKLHYKDHISGVKSLDEALCADLTKKQRKQVEETKKNGYPTFGIMLYAVKSKYGFLTSGGYTQEIEKAYHYTYKTSCDIAKDRTKTEGFTHKPSFYKKQ